MPSKNDDTDKHIERDAAADVVRGQLDALYDSGPRIVAATDDGAVKAVADPAAEPQAESEPPKSQQQIEAQQVQPYRSASSWQQYHAQWQDYYQKYYERYYVGRLHQAITETEDSLKTPEEKKQGELLELREKILDTAKTSAKKARKSRHFIPLISATFVVLVVAFLQYNEIIVANVQAYVSPGAIDPQDIVVDPTTDTQVSADPKLIIPKINVDVPTIYGVGLDYDSEMAAMQKGVAHFAPPGADSVPGQVGNTVFSGHSSNDLFEPGDYKFVFSQLSKLQNGDPIYVNYNSVRYTYSVIKSQVVSPSNVQALYGYTDKPYLTLITCTPLGTSQNRLLVTAEQISPDPSKAAAANTFNTNTKATIPGNTPTALEKLFGAKG